MRMRWKAVPDGDPFETEEAAAPTSPATKAILVLFVVVGVVLAGFVALIVAIAALAN